MADFSRDTLSTMLREKLGISRYSAQIDRALDLAYRGHLGQFRDQREPNPTNRVPYIVHPVGAALLAAELIDKVELDDSCEDVISACITHDLLEDTDVTAQVLERATSKRTLDIVLALTKPSIGSDLSRQERNDRFLKQIIDGGRSAMFVKACDYLQNISRPDQTPLHLLEKAVRKGRTSYLKLFDEGNLPSVLKEEYLKRLELAEQYREPPTRNPGLTIRTLSDAGSYCVAIAERKVLELHDVVEIIERIFDTTFVRIMSNEDFSRMILVPSSAGKSQKIRAAVSRAVGKGEIVVSELPRDSLSSFAVGLMKFLVVPISPVEAHGNHEREMLFVGVQHSPERDWANIDSLRMCYTYLSERVRLQEERARGNLEMKISELGLFLDVSDVQRLQLTHRDLRKLRSLVDYAEFARNVIARAVDFELRERQTGGLPLVESRVKSPSSIAKKMISRGFRDHSQVDDLVGIRVICASSAECQRVAQRLRAAVSTLVLPGV